jgi:hypothetical protein
MGAIDYYFRGPCVTQQRIGVGRRDFPRSNASNDNASIGKALMPKSSKPNNTIDPATKNMPALVRAPTRPHNDVELVKLRARPARGKQPREAAFPSDGSWTEWKVYGSPDIIEDTTLESTERPKKSTRKWTPRIRSRLNKDGSLDIIFLYRGR